ncbi:hypothetical protein GCM10028791_40530 [Echinicola sediminis]
MEFNPKDEADFLRNPFFVKWVNQPNDHSNRYWENWCAKNPDKVSLLYNAKQVAKSLKPKEENRIEAGKFQEGLDRLIAANNDKKTAIRPLYKSANQGWSTFGRSIAASILLMGMLMIAYATIFSPVEEEMPIVAEVAMIHKEVPKGMKKSVSLPDGSRVILNAGSSISYPEEFGASREIELKGQAFFDVKRDPSRPFIVKSGDLQTTVLGTSFDVKAYEDQDQLHVAVVTGKVKVATGNGIETHITPREATFYNSKTREVKKEIYDYETLIGWKDKILKFQDAQYPEVFNRLSNWYNVSFVFEKGVLLKGDYTGRFEDQSLKNVLFGMEYSAGITFEIEGQTVYVKSKK